MPLRLTKFITLLIIAVSLGLLVGCGQQSSQYSETITLAREFATAVSARDFITVLERQSCLPKQIANFGIGAAEIELMNRVFQWQSRQLTDAVEIQNDGTLAYIELRFGSQDTERITLRNLDGWCVDITSYIHS